MAALRSLCVYCGSQPGTDPAHARAASVLGRMMGESGMNLVYGGGAEGVMGGGSGAGLVGGGAGAGGIPPLLIAKESNQESLRRLTQTVITDNMHERKHAMFERSDAFVALPGGIGTLEELIEVMTWSQLGRHEKPIVIANIGGFWDPLLLLIDHMRAQGFIHTQVRVRPIVVEDAAQIVPSLLDWASCHPARSRDDATLSRL